MKKSICKSCGQEIIKLPWKQYWEHVGELQPRHIAQTKEEADTGSVRVDALVGCDDDFEKKCLGQGTCPACLNYGHRMDHHLALIPGDGKFDLKCRNCQREYRA